jgi:hypothetical protein
MKNLHTYLILTILFTISSGGICYFFDSSFANHTIDWVSFFAGTFLAVEGIYKTIKFRKQSLRFQIFRSLRIIIGFSIFGIHLIQYLWGINAEVIASPLRQALIDWFAFSFGIFLILESGHRIITAKAPYPIDQILRGMRFSIGTCVFSIHLLQFARF